MAASPKTLGYRMPAEWDRHEGTWLSWPHYPRTWVGNFGPIPLVFVEIVRGLCANEKVNINVRDAGSEAQVRQLLQNAAVDCQNVFFYPIPTDDAWARDHGPIFIVRDRATESANASGESGADGEAVPAGADVSRVAVIDWKFNAWGGKYPPWDDDDAVPERIAAQLKLPCFHPRMILEGGSIDVNGLGTLLTTESVLLNPNRNPQLSRKQIEGRLDDYLRARNVIWLNAGIVGDDTDGHIDDLARFVNTNTVVAVVEEDSADVNYRALHENFERLQSARDQDGSPLQLVKLPTPGKVIRENQGFGPVEERLPASYANFYIGNATVLVPVFGREQDKQALGILGELFPGRKMVPIRCNDLVGGYGAIHCVTQQQPV